MENDTFLNDYFYNSKSWYFTKFLLPRISLLPLMLLLVSTFISIYTIINILNLSTAVTIMRIPIYVENDADEIYQIKSLLEKGKSSEEVFAHYMIARYVLLRETYSPNLLEKTQWESLMRNISVMSSHKNFDAFLNDVLPSKNPLSRIIKYRFNTRLIPNITQITMKKFSGTKPTEAEVFFTISECNENYDHCIAKDRVAKVRFEINFQPDFKFKVAEYTKYKATEYAVLSQ